MEAKLNKNNKIKIASFHGPNHKQAKYIYMCKHLKTKKGSHKIKKKSVCNMLITA